MHEAQKLHVETFRRPALHTVCAPGRAELLGNHTDYNHGWVMALAVDKAITWAVSPRSDHRVELVSTAFPGRVRFNVEDLAKDPEAPWADYVKGLLLELRRAGVAFAGFNAAIHGTIPLGAGLSSSAALLVATALSVRKLFPYTLTEAGVGAIPERDERGELPRPTAAEKLAIAKVCQAAENRFVGVNCGLLDYLSSLFGRADHIVILDFLTLTADWTPLPHEVAVVICPSGVQHALVGGEYNDRRRHCEAAARALGVASLREVDVAGLEAERGRLAARDYACARHVVGENDRVTRGSALLRAGDVAGFGQLLFASHLSSRDDFQNSCPELDALVECARGHAACLGARLTGGGFGGATLNLVWRREASEFQQHLAAGYRQATGRELESWVCQAVDGAG